MKPSHKAQLLSRRRLIDASAHSLAALSMFHANAFGLTAENPEPGREVDAAPSVRGRPTHFQHACMTLPYSSFPLDRALRGIQASGFRYVAWGVRHREENGEASSSDGRRCSARISQDTWKEMPRSRAGARHDVLNGLPRAPKWTKTIDTSYQASISSWNRSGADVRPHTGWESAVMD